MIEISNTVAFCSFSFFDFIFLLFSSSLLSSFPVYLFLFSSSFLCLPAIFIHWNDVIMNATASQITSLTIVYSTIYSGADKKKHQSSASLAFERGIHRWPVNSPHKWPVTRKMFPFNDVIMICPLYLIVLGRCGCDFNCVNFNHTLEIHILSIQVNIAL